MRSGLSLLAHYTLSKFLDDVEAANKFGSSGSYMDAYNRRLDKGLSGSDIPHRVVIEARYEVHAFKAGRVLHNILGGWRLGKVETAESGPAFTVISSANATNTFPAGPLRPNLVHSAALRADQRTVSRGSTLLHLRIRHLTASEVRRDQSSAAHLLPPSISRRRRVSPFGSVSGSDCALSFTTF